MCFTINFRMQEDYNASHDKLQCPQCKKPQSFDEVSIDIDDVNLQNELCFQTHISFAFKFI